MQLNPPRIGQTYVSRTDPTLVVYVVDINNDDESTPFTVECCDPVYKDDTMNADGLEMTADVWEKHKFKLLAED
jgi:hypothetical protein